MLRSSSFLLFILTILLSICAVPANADGIPVYLVAGSVTMVGLPGCASPCTETIGFSFDVSFQYSQAASGVAPFVSNLTQIGSGVLGTYTLNPPGGGIIFPAATCIGNTNLVAVGGPAGAEVDLYVCTTGGPNSNVVNFAPSSVPTLGPDAVLYACFTAACINDFDPHGPDEPAIGIFQDYPLEYSVKLLPEPPTFLLLAAGMLALGLLGVTYRKFLP